MTIRIKFLLAVCAAAMTCHGEPIPRAGNPGPHMLLGTSVMSDDQNLVAKSIGFSHSQTDSDHLTVNETAPGVWDWSQADVGLAAMQKAGMHWQYFRISTLPPNGIARPINSSLRSAYVRNTNSPRFPFGAPTSCPGSTTATLRSHSITAAAHRTCMRSTWAFTAISAKPFFRWAGIPTKKSASPKMQCQPQISGAATNLRAFHRNGSKNKYRSISKLNATWGTKFKSFSEVTYPTAAFDKTAPVNDSPQSRRYWLDFVQRYNDSMTIFTGDICLIARHYFPQSLLELPVGGGSEDLMFGQDNRHSKKSPNNTMCISAPHTAALNLSRKTTLGCSRKSPRRAKFTMSLIGSNHPALSRRTAKSPE